MAFLDGFPPPTFFFVVIDASVASSLRPDAEITHHGRRVRRTGRLL